MGKAKPAKHTAAEINAKKFAATVNRGGGKEGLQDRLGGSVGHARFRCNVCMATAPSIKNMQTHFEAKHPSMAWSESQVTDLHATAGGVTTQGVAVRGSKKK